MARNNLVERAFGGPDGCRPDPARRGRTRYARGVRRSPVRGSRDKRNPAEVIRPNLDDTTVVDGRSARQRLTYIDIQYASLQLRARSLANDAPPTVEPFWKALPIESRALQGIQGDPVGVA